MNRISRLGVRPARPALEPLEDRLALSWGAVPPSVVSIAASTAVTLNSSAAASGLAAISTTEVDYYSFVAPRAGSYRLSALTPSSSLDTVLGVFNSAGQRLAYNDDLSSSNRDSQLVITLTAGQRTFFGITNYSGTRGGAYTWSVQGPTGTTLTDDRYENNDSLSAASNLGTLTARQTVSGLVMADTQDWFRFTMSGSGGSNDYLSIAFTHSQGDLDLRLYDSAGTLVRYSDGSTNSERIALNGLAAGTYYAQVYGYRGVSNPSYSLDIQPGLAGDDGGGGGGGGGSAGNRVLYLNFDGYAISRAELTRWAGSDWASSVNEFDADRNGVSVGRFLAARADREQVISRMLQLIQDDLRPFGITVQRHTGGAVEGVGASTIFLGPSTLSDDYYHVACDVDIGNNNRTDIAFVGDEDWGTLERTALAMADVTLHEAGHTWGLWHVNSGTAVESMGLRYSVSNQNLWAQNTSFLDRTFAAYVSGGVPHGPGSQNSYRSMLAAFPAAAAASAAGFTADLSRAGVLTLTTQSAGVDRIRLRRLANGNTEVTINGEVFELLRGYRQVNIYTSGDVRDTVQVLNPLGAVAVRVYRGAGLDVRSLTKDDDRHAAYWSGDATDDHADCDQLPARVASSVPVGSSPLLAAGLTAAREQLSDSALAALAEVLQRRRDSLWPAS